MALPNDVTYVADVTDALKAIKLKLSSAQLTQFSRLSSNIARMQFALGKKNKISQLFDGECDYQIKCNEKAEKYRADGDKLFKIKKYNGALRRYNASVMYAQPAKQSDSCYDSTQSSTSQNPALVTHNGCHVKEVKSANQHATLAMSLVCRSATLYHLSNYKAALLDINSALFYEYNESDVYKLLDRKGKCQIQMELYSDAMQSYAHALHTLHSIEVDDKSKDIWIQIFQKHIQHCKEKSDQQMGVRPKDSNESMKFTSVCDLTKCTSPNQKLVPLPKGKSHAFYKFATEAFSIEKSSTFGRYAVAGEDVNVGDVIVAEPPYACILYPEYYSTHCFYCLNRTDSLVGKTC